MSNMMMQMKTTGILSLVVVLMTFLTLSSCQEASPSDTTSGGDMIGKLPVHEAIKSHDPALDDALGKLVVKVVLDGQVNTKLDKPYTQTTLDTAFYSWKACVRLPIFNITCVEPYLSVKDLTTGVRLTSDGTTLLSKSSPGTSECVNDAKLLGLVTLTPLLLPFKPLLDRVIKLAGYLPAQMMSACVKLQDFQLTKDAFKGCVVFNTNIACWRGKCVFQKSLSLGCFNLPFTQNGGKLVVKAGQLRRRRNTHLTHKNSSRRRSVASLPLSSSNSHKRVHKKRQVLRQRV